MRYKVTGEAICTKTDDDDFTFQAVQLIEQDVDCVDSSVVGQVGLDVWLKGRGWDDGKWINGPRIVELPTEVVVGVGVGL